MTVTKLLTQTKMYHLDNDDESIFSSSIEKIACNISKSTNRTSPMLTIDADLKHFCNIVFACTFINPRSINTLIEWLCCISQSPQLAAGSAVATRGRSSSTGKAQEKEEKGASNSCRLGGECGVEGGGGLVKVTHNLWTTRQWL